MPKKEYLNGKEPLEKCPICGSNNLDPDTGDIQPDKTLARVPQCRRCENWFGETWKACGWWFIVDNEEES
jgi:hypothetical protein